MNDLYTQDSDLIQHLFQKKELQEILQNKQQLLKEKFERDTCLNSCKDKTEFAFVSDSHFYHQNIIQFQNRPFNGTREMNEFIISQWNTVCGHETIVYFLGDFLLGGEGGDRLVGSIISRLNFKHLHFIKGNHDNAFCRWYKETDPRNITLYNSYLETKIGKQMITLCHYPVLSWNKKSKGAWMLCGHCHYNLKSIRAESNDIGKILDVGVDGNNFLPYSLEQVKYIMDQKPIDGNYQEFKDHH
jgi:calcineurin-like phosphoesterase family protein